MEITKKLDSRGFRQKKELAVAAVWGDGFHLCKWFFPFDN
jgi:regulator of replication initiation timing